MIYVLGGGGGSAYAFIIATYPEGSVITCTNSVGKRKLANDKIIFYVKKPRNGETQTCHVECHLGEDSTSKDVEITYEGQSVSISLSYAYVLWTNGDGLAAAQNIFKTTGLSGSMFIYSETGNMAIGGYSAEGRGGVETKSAIQIPAGQYNRFVVRFKLGDYPNNTGYGSAGFTVYGNPGSRNLGGFQAPNSGYNETVFTDRPVVIPADVTSITMSCTSQNGHVMQINDIRFLNVK